jgi:hypothetical protein
MNNKEKIGKITHFAATQVAYLNGLLADLNFLIKKCPVRNLFCPFFTVFLEKWLTPQN